MTHVCYSLQEAADKLKLTETVLVRLSQYFKMPRAAYEASGYLSFKGDLAFTEPDLRFFIRVKERLLMGDTLEMVKRHAESLGTLGQSIAFEAQEGQTDPVSISGAYEIPNAGIPALPSAPMREIQDRQPYEKAAETSFARYKSVHRTGLGRIFESMLKEVGVTSPQDSAAASGLSDGNVQNAKTHKNYFGKKRDKMADTKVRAGTFSSFLPPGQTRDRMPEMAPERPQERSGLEMSLPTPEKGSAGKDIQSRTRLSSEASVDATWEQLLKQAVEQPRVLNSHLKSAAALLRERATRQDGHSFKNNSE